MLRLGLTRTDAATGATGRIYVLEGTTTTLTGRLLTLPATVAGVLRMPASFWYRGFVHVLGLFSRILRIALDGTVSVCGLQAPSTAPTLAASGTGLTGSYIGYISFAQEDAQGKILQQSGPSKGSSTFAAANQGRGWSGLPLVSPDAHATHIYGWVSVDGSTPFRVWRRRLGETATVTEKVPDETVEASEAAPVSSATGDFDINARGVLPYATAGVMYHDLPVMIDPTYPGVVIGERFEPWAFNSDEDRSRIRTRGGEQPIGLFIDDDLDAVIVLCRRSAYILRGWDITDLEFKKFDDFGTVSHQSIATHRKVTCFMSEQGPIAYSGGSFRHVAKGSREAWIAHYVANLAAYDECSATFDTSGRYMLLVPMTTAPKTRVWVGDVRAMLEMGQSEPWWSRDIRTRGDKFVGILMTDDDVVPVVVFGDENGELYAEDVTDADDAADAATAGTYTGGKEMTVQFGHHFPTGPAGDDEGHAFHDVSLFADHPNNNITGSFAAGDENAFDGETPKTHVYRRSTDARMTRRTTKAGATFGLSGKGLGRRYVVTNPLSVRLRGDAIRFTTVGAHGPKKA
jgi:hypothetical protein